MASEFDLTFGNLAIGRGLVSREHVQAAYAQLLPGQSLAGMLVQHRLLAPEAAAALDAEVRAGGLLATDNQLTAHTAHATSAPPMASGSDEARLPREGEVVADRYRVLATLGRGGMGAVFRATDLTRDVDVALKVMLPSADASGNALIRFEREAKAVTRVDGHAGVVRVLDFGLHGLLPYAAQDLVEGQDLKGVIRERGPLPLERALEVGEAVSRAIAHCHERSVLHRDLKPANILIRTEDGQPFVTDFGLALEQDVEERLTKTGEVLGTPAYMSPEQADGDVSAIDARTDVYALGAVVFEAVTGRPPFEGGGLIVLKKVLLDLPPAPSTLREDLPPELDLILAKALAKRQADRYATAGAFADDLAALRRGDPVTVKPPSRYQHFKWQLGRLDRRAWTKLGAAIVAAVLLLFAYPAYRAGLRRELENTAQEQLERLPSLLAKESPHDEDSELRSLLSDLLATERELRDLEGAPQAPGDEESQRDRWRRLERVAEGEGDADSELANTDAEKVKAEAEKKEQAEVRASPLGILVGKASDEVRLAFRRAVRRTLTRSGFGWTTGNPVDPEAMRLEAMALLGWNAPPSQRVELTQARALLERAGEVQLGKRIDDLEREVDEDLAAGVEATRRLFRPRQSVRAWGSWSERRRALGPLKNVLDTFLRAKKPKAARRAFGIVQKAVPIIRVRARQKDLRLERWGTRAPYDAIRGWYEGQLKPMLGGKPKVEVELPWTALAIDITACARAVDGRALEAYTRLLVSLQDHIDWHDDRFRARCAELVFVRTHALVSGGQPPPRDLIHFFPRMKMIPGSHLEVLIERYRKERLFQKLVVEQRSGDAYLIWAQSLFVVSRQRTQQNAQLLIQLWAKALGDALSTSERAALGLGKAHRVPLSRPMSPEWVSWAKYRLADVVFRVHWARLGAGRGDDSDLARCLAGLELFRSLQEVAFVKRGGRLDYLEQRLESLLFGSKLLTARGQAAEGRQLLEEGLGVGREGLALVDEMHGQAQKKDEHKRSLMDVDIAGDPDKLETVWSRITRSLQHLHQLRGEIDQVLAVTKAIHDRLRKRRNGINVAAEVGLLGIVVEAPQARWERDRKVWEARARKLLADVIASRPKERRALEKWYSKHDMAVYRLAEFRFRNNDLDGVLTEIKRARGIDGARDMLWAGLLSKTILGLLAQKRVADARWIAAEVKGTLIEKQAVFRKALDALARVKGNQ